MNLNAGWRGLVVAILTGLTLVIPGAPVVAQSKRDVDQAKEEAQAALARYKEIQGRYDAAVAHYQQVNAELQEVTGRVVRLTDAIQRYEEDTRRLRQRVQSRAVEAYMEGGSGIVKIVLEATSVNDLLTAQEFLQRAAEQDLEAVQDLAANRAAMDSLRGELEVAQAELQVKEQEAAAAQQELAGLSEEAYAAYTTLDAEYHEVLAQYEEEQRRLRLAAIAQATGSAAGAPAAATPGFICPLPGASFINDWGFPRSGGRTHKGTDMFAPFGAPIVAVANGVVSIRNSSLGGLSIWLRADYGTAYYYAHLSGVAVGEGQAVGKGQVIGYNGNSGNASGGAPHLHFEIHPGGGAPANPYPTLASHC